TGVQTCALPIYFCPSGASEARRRPVPLAVRSARARAVRSAYRFCSKIGFILSRQGSQALRPRPAGFSPPQYLQGLGALLIAVLLLFHVKRADHDADHAGDVAAVLRCSGEAALGVGPAGCAERVDDGALPGAAPGLVTAGH